MLKKILFTFIASVMLSSTMVAQGENVFPENRPEFISALKDYFAKSNNKELQKFFDGFQQSFNGGVITEEEI